MIDDQNFCKQFNELGWHDSELISFMVFPNAERKSHEIRFSIKFISRSDMKVVKFVEKELILYDCTIAKIDLDLDGKYVCGDSIATAFCSKDSDLKSQIETNQLKYEKSPLAQYYHFSIELIPPGGKFDIFAKDFKIAESGGWDVVKAPIKTDME